MTADEEYSALISEHLQMQNTLRFSGPEEAERFLYDFFPVELFLKRLYLAGESVTEDNGFYTERERFKYPSPDVNITMAKHFRYHRLSPHEHSFFQLNYVWCGKGTMSLCGSDVTVSQGDAILLAPNTSHCLKVFCDDCVVIKTYIKSSTFERVFFRWLGENNILSDFLSRALYSGADGKYIIFHTGADQSIRSLLLKLYVERTNHAEYFDIISDCVMTEVFCRLVRDHIGGSESSADTHGGTNIGFILKYIKDNYRTVTLEELACAAGYSKNYLCKLISNSTGKTFTDILNEVKLSAAAVMLTTTNLSVWEIGEQAGFNSNEHFHRVFKRCMRVSPLAYRKAAEERREK